jgi:hypothetical protein
MIADDLPANFTTMQCRLGRQGRNLCLVDTAYFLWKTVITFEPFVPSKN